MEFDGPCVTSSGKSRVRLHIALLFLHTLCSSYDVGISNALLPMVNAHEIYPSWEDEMHSAYVHLNKRLSPAWLETEPPEVIAACREFVDGYNTIFADNFMT